MEDSVFAPDAVDVPVGTTLRFVNVGNLPHTATARDGSFDSGLVQPGGTFSHMFATAGTFPIRCTLHPEMVGTVTVRDADGSAPPPEPDAVAASAPPRASEPPGVAEDGTATVSMIEDEFLPPELVVAPGTEVTWRNDGEVPHTATAVDGSFDSGLVASGEVFTFRFEAEGTFDYTCILHPGMEGTVVVDPAAASGGPGAEDTLVPVQASGFPSGLLQVVLLGAFTLALLIMTGVMRRFLRLQDLQDASGG
jgi:plastocyanin